MKMIHLSGRRQEIRCPADVDVTLVVPPEGMSGGLDIIGAGRNVIVTGRDGQPGDLRGNRIETFGSFDRLEFFNLRSDASGAPEPRDILGFGGEGRTRVVRRCRFSGAPGRYEGRHPDIGQDRPESRTDFLYIVDCTFAAGYQVLMLKLWPDGTGSKRVVVERTNILNSPKARQQARSFAIITEGKIDITYRDVYLDPKWPRGLEKAHLPNDATVTGKIILGIPPGGDFCPA